MSADWKEAVLEGVGDGGLPDGYRREGEIIGRAELLDESEAGVWSASEFVARSQTPHTTSAVEARMRRRYLKRVFETFEIDPGRPILDLGCADGLLARDLLDLGSEKLVSTDILPQLVATLDRSLATDQRERIVLLVDDLMRLPLREAGFGAVCAWGILSVSGDFDRALDLAWKWLAPGGYLLLAEPLLEQALLYPIVRGDLDEFHRVWRERTRAGMWEDRDDRYRVNSLQFYAQRLEKLPSATVAETSGISMLPSLLLGGLLQDDPVSEPELAGLTEMLSDPDLDEIALWRQALWIVRKG